MTPETDSYVGRTVSEPPIPGRGPAPWMPGSKAFQRRRWSLGASRRYCLQMASSHYENFPVMLSLFSREQREALAAIYAFARTADDFADEHCYQGMREQLLGNWQAQLQGCVSGDAVHPVFVALADAVRRFDLSIHLFEDLLNAFRQDCSKRRYDTFDELLDYCRRSANPVGRLVLGVLGTDRPELIPCADKICTALQLANHWQDISVDLEKDRIYIPREDLDRFRISERSLFAGTASRVFGELVRFEVQRTRELFREGWPLVVKAGYPGNLYFLSVWLGGRAVLRMVRESGRTILARRPVLNANTFTRTLVGAGLDRLPFVTR
jgi:hydroxysqualene synthase